MLNPVFPNINEETSIDKEKVNISKKELSRFEIEDIEYTIFLISEIRLFMKKKKLKRSRKTIKKLSMNLIFKLKENKTIRI
jgi:hypothetical protein